jgi:hypothetical protein
VLYSSYPLILHLTLIISELAEHYPHIIRFYPTPKCLVSALGGFLSEAGGQKYAAEDVSQTALLPASNLV